MDNVGILIITTGVIIVTIISCVTNFFCNYYNDFRDEKIKDARKAIKYFEEEHINYGLTRSCNATEEDVLGLIDELKKL